jgi:hypothetical protein
LHLLLDAELARSGDDDGLGAIDVVLHIWFLWSFERRSLGSGNRCAKKDEQR